MAEFGTGVELTDLSDMAEGENKKKRGILRGFLCFEGKYI